MKHDHLAGWIRFLASTAAPPTAMRPLELEGYLTGLIVAPDLVPPSMGIEALWGEDEPVFDTADQFQAVLDSVMGYHNELIDTIDRQGAGWRPMFMDKSGTSDLDEAAIWVRGFWQAMSAVPASWSALAEDERTRILVQPFATFVDLGALHDEPLPDNIDEIRQESASLIPRVLPALRKPRPTAFRQPLPPRHPQDRPQPNLPLRVRQEVQTLLPPQLTPQPPPNDYGRAGRRG